MSVQVRASYLVVKPLTEGQTVYRTIQTDPGFLIVWVTGAVLRDDNPVPWPAEYVRVSDAGRASEAGDTA